MSAEGIAYRLKRLKEKGFLLGVHAMIDANQLGFLWCVYNAKLSSKVDVEKFILSKPYIVNSVELFGKWSLGITFFSRSLAEVQAHIEELRGFFKNDLDEDMSVLILKTYKYPALAEGVITSTSSLK